MLSGHYKNLLTKQKCLINLVLIFKKEKRFPVPDSVGSQLFIIVIKSNRPAPARYIFPWPMMKVRHLAFLSQLLRVQLMKLIVAGTDVYEAKHK